MELFWKNKMLEDVDVLCDTFLKAYITFDKAVAVIMDRDCERDFEEVTHDIEGIDGAKNWFTITFSPERIICEMDFLFMPLEDKEEVIGAVEEFKKTFLRTVIDIAKEKGDLVRAEVIRIVWKRFNTDGSIHSIKCNSDEVKKFLTRLDEEKRGQRVRGIISPTWKEIIELILKYTIYLVQWEKGKGRYAYARSNSEWDKKNSDAPENTNLKMRLGRKFKSYYNEILASGNVMYEVTLQAEKMLYENLRLSYDETVDDFRKFFYKQHKSNGTSGRGKENTTIIGYYAIKKIHECVIDNKEKGKMAYFNISIGVDEFTDEDNEVCEYLSSSIELVMMNLAQINFKPHFMHEESEERRSFLRELDTLQFRIMPFMYVASNKGNESLSMEMLSELKEEAKSKQNEIYNRLRKRDSFSILGGRDMFSGIGRAANKITLMDEKRNGDNMVDCRARTTYWNDRRTQLNGKAYKNNADLFDLSTLDALECAIAERFNSYIKAQKKGISGAIKKIVEPLESAFVN